MKGTIEKEWTEIKDGMLEDHNEDGWNYFLFAEDVKLRRGPKTGKLREHRRKRLIEIHADTRNAADAKVAALFTNKCFKLVDEQGSRVIA